MDTHRPPPPTCARCRHYRITHDAGFPYACELHGFKTRRMPWRDVLEASGTHCLGFAARPPRPAGGAG